MDPRPSSLDNPDYAGFAWRRYRRLMLWMTVASALAVVVGLGALRLLVGPIPGIIMGLVAGGIFFSVLLAAALMGLVFLSSGSGHDESIGDPFDGKEDPR